MLHAEGEVIHGLEAQLLLEGIKDVRHGRGRVVLEGLGLTILQIDFHHVGHEGGRGLLLLELLGAQWLTLMMIVTSWR